MASTQPSLHLLHTKLFIPRAHPEVIERSSLIRKLDDGLKARLVLVTAPAGYGKTTLLSRYIEHSNRPFAWLSLDDRDNEPTRFWSYFIASLQTLEGAFGRTAQAMLLSPQPPPIENILVNLLNEIALMPDEFIICLDDYHAITASTINQGMVFIIENLPEQMHLVIAGRSEPPFPLHLLRTRRQLLEFNASDLRFSKAEATQFFNQLMKLNLSSDQIETIDKLTEGWAAGIQLAALTLLGSEDISKQLQTFSGSHRYIFDYLAQEVLNNQPQEVQTFLIHTSILEQLSGDLCDSILEGKLAVNDSRIGDSQSILEYLEKANLFIVPLDQERCWYRYHRLFLDFLHARLVEQVDLSEIKELHTKASSWYKQNKMILPAIDHALDSGNYSEAATLINQDVTEIFSRSELPTLTRWIQDFPPETLYSEPRLNMIAAWAYLAIGQHVEVESHLKIVEDILGSQADGSPESLALPPETRGALAEICCLRASLAINQYDLPKVFEQSHLSESYLNNDAQSGLFNEKRDIQAVSYFNQAILFELTGEITKASESFSKTIALNVQNMHLIPMAISHLAHLQELQGLLREAEETYRMAMRITEDYQYPLPLSGMADTGLGNLLCERNHLERAQVHLRNGINLGKMWSHWEAMTSGYLGLARVAMANENFTEANNLLDKAVAITHETQFPWLTPLFEAYQAIYLARQGKLDAAADWSQKVGFDSEQPIEFNQETIAIPQTRVWIAIHKYDQALRLINELLKANESRHAWGQVIQLLIFNALANYSQGELETALTSIERALRLAEPENYRRIFLDEGESMHAILRAVDDRLSGEDDERMKRYIGQLLSAFQVKTTLSTQGHMGGMAMLEPLSEREIEVIKLLEEGLTNQEIAAQLFISLNTVKAHLKHIYSKLGVNNRVQAISKIHEIGFK
jgi:LuxR family maltose regulon positive regulatory protein